MTHKIASNKTNGFYVDQSYIWKLVIQLDKQTFYDFQLLLLERARSSDITTIIECAWIHLSGMIRRHEKGTEHLWNIPYPFSYSRTCMEVFLQDPRMIELAEKGTINWFMVQRIARAKGVW